MGTSRRFALVALAGVAAVVVAGARPETTLLAAAVFALVTAVTARAAEAGTRREQASVVRRLEGKLDRRVTELGVERRRMERLLERLPLAVLLFTPGGLAYANPAARELFPGAQEHGWSPQRVLVHTGLAEAVREARDGGRTVHLEVERDERWLAARALVTAEGEVALVVADQTEARRVEALRRDFVVNASHELKTPAASLQALADALEVALGRDPERAAPMVARLRAEAARMGQLVGELLDLARLEEAAAEPRGRVDLAAVVRDVAADAAGEAEERGLRLTIDVPDSVGLVAVPEDVRLMVANLVSNAVRYNRPRGRVHVSARVRGGSAVLEVVDTGLGLAEADRVRVFERFYRVDRARSRAQGGTGLGLALVRHAAQRAGGEVSVDSVLGEGSTFRVVLPLAAGDEEHP